MTWQPIETAPKDGTDILVCSTTTGECEIVWWDEEGKSGKWKWKTHDGLGYHEAKFDYWQPTPELPSI